MSAGNVTLLRPDGLHLLARASLADLAVDPGLEAFAGGLVAEAIAQSRLNLQHSLAQALYHLGPEANPLLLCLLIFDAEVSSVVEDERRVFPLPGFLTYRTRLSPDRVSPSTLRLPPLNPDGHYLLDTAGEDFSFAIRLDLHPYLKVAGHVRIAVSSSTRLPVRLLAAEHRLNRQVMTEGLLKAAISAGSAGLQDPLTEKEQASLVKAFRGLTLGNGDES